METPLAASAGQEIEHDQVTAWSVNKLKEEGSDYDQFSSAVAAACVASSNAIALQHRSRQTHRSDTYEQHG